MTLQLDLEPEVEARLKAAAEERGLATEEYALELLKAGSGPVGVQVRPRISTEEFLEKMRKLAVKAPHLDEDETFSREMIYGDHD